MSLAWVEHPLLLVVNVLAAFRLTRLWISDSLPPLPRLRRYLLRRLGTNPLAELVDCPWCAGWWISLGVVLLASTGSWWSWVAVPLAVSALVGLLAARPEND